MGKENVKNFAEHFDEWLRICKLTISPYHKIEIVFYKIQNSL